MRDKTVAFRATVDERDRLERLAQMAGLSHSELLRRLLIGARIVAVEPPAIAEKNVNGAAKVDARRAVHVR